MSSGPTTTRCIGQIGSIAHIEALEAVPYDELVPAQSIYDLFVNVAALHGTRPALTVLASHEPTNIAASLTHRDLLSEVTRAANLLHSLGVEDNDVVSVVSKTYAHVPVMIWGAEVAGVASCLNYMLTSEVLAELLRVENAKVLVCPGPTTDTEIWEKLRAVIEQVPSLKAVLLIGGGGPANPLFLDLDRALAKHSGDALKIQRGLGRETRAALFHTGGTTGLPKLVPHTHGNQIHAAWSFAQAFGITEQDVGLNGLPMFHVGGTSTWGLSILGAGGHVVVMTPVGYRDPAVVKNVWKIAAHFRATMIGSVPTTIGAMSEIDASGFDLSSLRMAQTGGATLPRAVADRFERRAGIPLLEQYGMTETAATIANTSFFGRNMRGSVGLRCPYSELRVVEEGAREPLVDCPPGSIGTVVCRGPQVVRGYLDPRQNRGAFTSDGWLITGDLGYLTEDQMLVLTGREKDLIIRGGHNIDPASIEEVANSHPAISASAAVGMPDAYAGEVPVIFVVPMQRQSIDVVEVAAFIQKRIAEPAAKPRHVFVVEELPTTTVGKIFKPALRDQAIVEKLRLEIEALDSGVKLGRVAFSSNRQGRKLATITLNASEEHRRWIEEKLGAALRDLTFSTAVHWA